jgi:ATP-dependent DNA helicase, recQ family
MILVNLSKKRIINFIPRKNTPLVSYAQDRIDGVDVILDKNVYEDRKEQFIKRINSVINYAQNERICRSRQLLCYFGETKSADCGQCDVCLSHTDEDNDDEQKIIRQQLQALLSDGKKHHITEIRQLNDNWELMQEVMREMILEEEILMDGSFLLLP